MALLALGAMLLLGSSSALAAVPSHPRTPALDIAGLNHACGVAIDSKGDLYASSAGASKILIFSPADHETPIGELANAKEPCGLAVDTKGNLYVSEQASGEVVRYAPTAYPFIGAPSYGPREVVDASGQARGIAVDPFDDRLYVAEGGHVSVYDSEGNLGIDETQRINCLSCTTGAYRLEFGGKATKPIAFEGEASEVKAALEELTSIGAGNVSVENESVKDTRHIVTFVGKLALTDVEALKCVPEGINGSCNISEDVKGFSGHIGEGQLTEATGVAAYTYVSTSEARTYNLAVADASADQLKLFSAPSFKGQKLRRTLDGPKEGEDFGFGAEGAYLTSDGGTCPPVAGKACSAGHFFVYDDAHQVIDELEASGALVSQTPFTAGDGAPTALAVDRSGGTDNGALYATTGAAANAQVLAFGALGAPSRSGPLKENEVSLTLAKACSVAIDSHGNRYVAVGTEVFVYPPTGSKTLTKFSTGTKSCRLAIDEAGNVYAQLTGKVVYFHPEAFPPVEGTKYGAAVEVAKQIEFSGEAIKALAVNPANGHLFVINNKQVIEYDSASNGSKVLNPNFGAGVTPSTMLAIAVYGATGNVYITNTSGKGVIHVIDPTGKELLTRITGVGSPKGNLGTSAGAIAVDQSNGHAIVFETEHQDLEEYEASGTFVASFGSFTELITFNYGVAVDNGAFSPNKGDVFLAYDDPTGEFDLWGFGALDYGARLTVVKDGPGSVTSEPPGIECGSTCSAEYKNDTEVTLTAVADNAIEGSEFVGWGEGDCEAEEIISATEGTCTVTMSEARQVMVSFRAPPQAIAKPAVPVTYTEATLRGEVGTTGLPTKYRFEYLTQAAAEQNEEEAKSPFEGAKATPTGELAPAEGLLAVSAHIVGLAEGTAYRFRLLVENDGGEAEDEGSFTTQEEAPVQRCSNAALRTGPSANLPDCRAYELVSPPNDNGYTVGWNPSDVVNGNFATALASEDGENVIFETYGGPLPTIGGNGVWNGYRASRGSNTWSTVSYGPSYAEMSSSAPGGVSIDHGYSFWATTGKSGTLDPKPEEGAHNARYLALPEPGADPACTPEPSGRFELIGCGSEGTDPEAIGRWISPAGQHVIFTSNQHLESDAPVKGTTAIYDRTPGGSTSVASLLPGDAIPSGSAVYEGVSADGSAVAFALEGGHYVRRGGETLEVTAGPATFAGLSHDGRSVFYLDKVVSLVIGGAPVPEAGLFVCDFEAGPCAGPGAHEATEIAPKAILVNVAADGSRAYFTSTSVLVSGAETGKDNLYLWEAKDNSTRFIAALAHGDVAGSQSPIKNSEVNLGQWIRSLDPAANGALTGVAIDPSRSTPNGGVLVFQSLAPLTGYDAEGHPEIFRYDATENSLVCVSCGPQGGAIDFGAQLQDETGTSPTSSGQAPIANLSADGKTIVFTSAEPLVFADHNSVADVYEWRDGQISLISTGQSTYPSYLYAVSASGDDVFFATREALVDGDDEDGGSQSIYDARVNGGFSSPVGGNACEGGEACRGTGSAQPSLPSPPTTSLPPESAPAQPRACPKGKHKVKRAGKVHCAKKHKAKKHDKHHHQKKQRSGRESSR